MGLLAPCSQRSLMLHEKAFCDYCLLKLPLHVSMHVPRGALLAQITALQNGQMCTCMCAVGGGAGQSNGTRSTSRAFDRRELPLSDWEIHESEVEICKREDGSLWHLGGGSFGQVFKAIRNGVQPVAGAPHPRLCSPSCPPVQLLVRLCMHA